MNLNNIRLEITAVDLLHYPPDILPEAAFIGRSNVGKSSLINFLVNRKLLARVSCTPGKTRVINFYNLDEKLRFVDLPGYGYAKVSQGERNSWLQMVNDYLYNRKELKLFLLLVDIRHAPNEMDIMMLEWLRRKGVDFIIVATKADKLKPSEIQTNLNNLRKIFKLSDTEKLMPVSTLKRTGREEIWDIINQKY